jgi:hypothetical protein
VSLSSDLAELLHGAERALHALGQRPEGDAAGLHALAAQIRAEADLVAHAGRLEASVPGSMEFESPGARDLAANVGEVARSLFDAARRLDAIADSVKRKAQQIADAQTAYDRSFSSLSGDISHLQSRMPGHGP